MECVVSHSELTFNAQRVLNYLLVSGAEDTSVPDDVCPSGQQVLAYRELVERGLLVKDDRYSGGFTFTLTEAGAATAEQGRKAYRRQVVQQRVLEVVADGGCASTMEITATPGESEFEPEELEAASKALDQWGLITGTAVFGPGLIRPEVTASGYQCLDSGYAPQAFVASRSGSAPAPAASTNFAFHGPVGAVQNGNHNIANVDQSQGSQLSEVLDLLAAARAIANDPATSDAGQTAIESPRHVRRLQLLGRLESWQVLVRRGIPRSSRSARCGW